MFSSIYVPSFFLYATKQINAIYYEPLALYLETAFIYLMFCTVLTRLQSWGERKLSAYERRGAAA